MEGEYRVIFEAKCGLLHRPTLRLDNSLTSHDK